MSLDRDKVTRAAEKLVARGKLNAAIDEYRKLLADSSNDTTTLNRVGDLYARVNRLDRAISLFKRTADHFIDEGFFVKAIAIYKKIIRLDPTQIEIYEKLADLYSRQGLVNESRSQYQVVADYYQKHSKTEATIGVYRKLIELEPDNPSNRLRLAELMRQADRPQEAITQFCEIASLLLGHGRADDAVKLWEEALDVDASNFDFVSDALLQLKSSGHTSAAERLLAAAGERNPDARSLSRVLGLGPVPPPPGVEEEEVEEEVEEALEAVEEAAGKAAETADAGATSDFESEDILVLDLDDEELSAELAATPVEMLGEAAAGATADESEIEIDLAELDAPRFGEVALSESELAHVERVDELLAEAETLAKFGLVDKAAERLEELLELDPRRVEAYDSLLSLHLDRGAASKVVQLGERLAELAAAGEAIDTWQGFRERLREEGYRFHGDRVVPPGAVVAAEQAGQEPPPPPAAATSEAGAEWLQEGGDDTAGADELFRAEEEFFDLATELEKELRKEGALEPDEGLLESLDEQSVEEIVEGFKKGMAETLSDGDYDTHYNLGIAYREMGLVDEAIGEFQLAAKDSRYLVDCCSLLAASFIDKGFPELAVKWYLRGLESPILAEDENLGLLYELGSLYLSMGEVDKARERFVEIYGINSNYRDVVAKLKELDAGGLEL